MKNATSEMTSQPVAQKMGLEFTLVELQKALGGGLADTELAGIVGGLTDAHSYLLTTIGYGCNKWAGSGVRQALAGDGTRR